MIEVHQKGRQRHVLVDSQGWLDLRQAFDPRRPHRIEPHPYTAFLGLDVFRDECPCTENDDLRS